MVTLMKENLRRIVPDSQAGYWRQKGFADCIGGESANPVPAARRACADTLTVSELKKRLKASGVNFLPTDRKPALVEKYAGITGADGG